MESVFNPVPQAGINNIVEAKGMYYYTDDGKKYIDLESGIWCASLGHQHPNVTQVIKKQLDTLIHISKRVLPTSINSVASKLLKISEINGKVMFLNTGSEAIEFSMIISKLINSKSQLISFKDNYVTAYGQATNIDCYIDFEPCLKCNNKCSNSCEVINKKITENCVFIFDPFCFSRKTVILPVKLIQTLDKEIKQKNGILVVDEITTGMGRTGKWFGYNHFDLNPDIVVLGKSLGNGYPVSAVIIKQEIICKVDKSNFVYYQSHQNDPLGCAVAESVIDTMTQLNLIEKSAALGNNFLKQLKQDLLDLQYVIDIRGIGLLIGIEIRKDIQVELISKKLMELGVLVGISIKFNMLNILPPLTIEKDCISEISAKIKQCILNIENE